MPHIAAFGTGAVHNNQCSIFGLPCETFVSKLNGNYGQALRKATILRGVTAGSIAVDSSLNIFVVGEATSGLATTAGAFQTKISGPSDGFVVKLDSSGYLLLFSTFLGGGGSDAVTDVAVNNRGMAFVTGYTNSTDFRSAPEHLGGQRVRRSSQH